MMNKDTIVDASSASGESAEDRTVSLLGVIERLCRADYFAEIAAMAVDSLGNQRIQCAFATTLQQISDELSEAKRELYIIVRGEGGAA